MIIGVDIDEVVADFSNMVLGELRQRHGVDLQREQWTMWNIEEVEDLLPYRAMIIDTIANAYAKQRMKTLAVIPSAQDTIRELAERHEMKFITARGNFFPEARAHTLHWFEKNRIPFQSIHFEHEKHVAAKELGVELFIEDNAGNALALAAIGVPVLLMDAPWNQNVAHPLITRVQDWHEIKEHIGRMEQQEAEQQDRIF